MAKSLLFAIALLFAVLAVVQAQMRSYTGHHLIRVNFAKQADVADFQKSLDHEIDVWTHDGALTHKSFNDLFVNKEDARVIMEHCAQKGLRCEVLSQNYQQILDEEQAALQASRARNADYFDTYHSYEETIQYITDLNKAFPKQTELFTLGQSWENKNLTGIVFRFGNSNSTTPRKAAWFDSGIHAREWISVPVTTFAMTQMAQNYGKDARVSKILDNIDVYWLPVVNPDGYSYTWKGDRMWRKNRRNNGGSSCPGVDLNRNWPAGWGIGASKSTCSETYMGPSALSEPESKALDAFFKAHKEVKAGINFHSYSQLLLRPYGFQEKRSPDEDSIAKQGAKMVADIKNTNGETYTNERAIDLYPAGGTLMDSYYDLYGFRYAYVTELRDTGRYGFVLPEKFIKPTVQENYQSILDLCDAVVALP